MIKRIFSIFAASALYAAAAAITPASAGLPPPELVTLTESLFVDFEEGEGPESGFFLDRLLDHASRRGRRPIDYRFRG